MHDNDVIFNRVAGFVGWIYFNLLGMVSPNEAFQMFSYAAAGLSALAVGVYHITKTIKIWRDGKKDGETKERIE
jgi:hypothetical protein